MEKNCQSFTNHKVSISIYWEAFCSPNQPKSPLELLYEPISNSTPNLVVDMRRSDHWVPTTERQRTIISHSLGQTSWSRDRIKYEKSEKAKERVKKVILCRVLLLICSFRNHHRRVFWILHLTNWPAMWNSAQKPRQLSVSLCTKSTLKATSKQANAMCT